MRESDKATLPIRYTIAPEMLFNSASDVAITKMALNQIGYLPLNEGKLTPQADREFWGALERFQRERGLHVDGIMHPSGETTREIGSLLSKQFEVANSDGSSRRSGPAAEQCEQLNRIDRTTCLFIGKRRGKRAAARCYATAEFRYAMCRNGTPLYQLPPLDTFNQ